VSPWGKLVSLVIGVDPGSRVTGWGLLERREREIVYIGSGIIRAPARVPLSERLLAIKRGLAEVIERFHPQALAVEDVFMAKNPKSTLTLGEARGIVLLAAAEAGIPVFEYSTREVKMSVVGAGGAHKSQVAAMVGRLLGLDHDPATEDETDAIAVAFCHAARAAVSERLIP
jgi:crossover junction endodeoxyribonuclease RuvC